MELQVGVKVLLKNREGKYLLLCRNPNKYPEVRTRWDIVGGRIEPGTPLLENLQREVYEETKLVLSSNVTLVAAQDILRVQDRHIVRLTYSASIEGTPEIDEESFEYRWCTKEDILTFPKSELDEYFSKLLNSEHLW